MLIINMLQYAAYTRRIQNLVLSLIFTAIIPYFAYITPKPYEPYFFIYRLSCVPQGFL
jgi:hypothetical protein